MKHSKRSRSDRNAEAEARQAATAKLSVEERLRNAYARPGNSEREVARLREKIVARDH